MDSGSPKEMLHYCSCSIDKWWNMHDFILDFPPMPSPHIGENIGNVIVHTLREWGILKKFGLLTLDNASNNDAAVRHILTLLLFEPNLHLFFDGKYLGFRCICHIINLVANDGLEFLKYTIDDLSKLGIAAPVSLQPAELFSLDAILSIKGFLVLAVGGLLVGFGSRYAGGCTSGHAISGLSDLQVPSLIAVVGFFIGGLIMTFFILPLIF
jgi:hypothetical protein